MNSRTLHIGIVNYPGVMESAVAGLSDILTLANNFGAQQTKETKIEPIVFNFSCPQNIWLEQVSTPSSLYAIVLPPCISGEYFLMPDKNLINWIQDHHKRGTIISSVCAGAFILSKAGLLNGRVATTHWVFAEKMAKVNCLANMDTDKILINDGDIITARGVMSWIDLGLEIVAQCTHPKVMRELGRFLVVDTGRCEQRYYMSFSPKLGHGDMLILRAQHHIHKHYGEPLSIKKLSNISSLTERTFLRRFSKATGIRPLEYIQRNRMQKACDLLETNSKCIEAIAEIVGYTDPSAFRRAFYKTIGLTPREFRKRFNQGEAFGLSLKT